MFLRRLGGWLPRPWGRRKPTRPDPPAPEPRWGDSSPENSGSDWDSAPETMGDVGPPATEDSGTPTSSRAAAGPSRGRRVEQPRGARTDALKWDSPASTPEPGRPDAGGAFPTPGRGPGDSGGAPGPEAPPEKPGRRQRLLGWLRGEPGAPPGDPEERLQISTNLTLHLLELLASSLLALCSRPLRAALDALGLRGALGLWLHGLLSFLAALHGLHAVLSLLTAHPLHFAGLFGLLQALVLAVSLREPGGDGDAPDCEGEGEEQRGGAGRARSPGAAEASGEGRGGERRLPGARKP